MAVILGLLIVCLGIYFLGLFFQVARLEKELHEGVTLLERFMMVTYALSEETGEKKEGEAGKAGATPSASKPA